MPIIYYYLKNILIVLITLVIFSPDLPAKDLYVTAIGGNDDISREINDIDNPWSTPGKAWMTAQAGDVVYFREGVYTVSSVIYTAQGHNGTETQPIIFKNYAKESVTITNGGFGNTLFGIEKEYNYVEGINFVGSGFGVSGRIFFIGENRSAKHFKVTNCTFTIPSSKSGDNVAAICLNGVPANHTVIENCIFSGPSSTSLNGIIIFRTQSLIIKNNEIYNFGNGIYFKHSNRLEDDGIKIINNYLHDVGTAIRTVSNYAKIENNLLVGGGIIMGDDGGIGDGWVGADHNIIRHNTFYNSSIKMVYQYRAEDPNKGCLNNTIMDNIFMKKCIQHQYTDINANSKSDYNLFPPGKIIDNNGKEYILHFWQINKKSDANSLSGAPTFVGGEAPASISDYALAEDSLGKRKASDGSDIGVNVSLVGTDTIFSTTEFNEELELQKGVEGEEWEEGELRLSQTPYQTPELVWLPQGIDLTKHTKGPFTVKIRVEGIDKQKNPSIYPRIRYYIGTGSSHGYFEMINEGDNVWRFDIPDPKWHSYRSNSLHYQVKLFDEEGTVISESRWEVELIDSFIQKD